MPITHQKRENNANLRCQQRHTTLAVSFRVLGNTPQEKNLGFSASMTGNFESYTRFLASTSWFNLPYNCKNVGIPLNQNSENYPQNYENLSRYACSAAEE